MHTQISSYSYCNLVTLIDRMKIDSDLRASRPAKKIAQIKNSDTPNDSLVGTPPMFTLTTGSKCDEV